MKLTNRLGLPDAVVKAVTNDTYTKGDSDISITTLIAPPRIRVLKKLHEDKIEEDVSDRIYSLLGQVMHGILDRASLGETDAIHEKRFYVEIEGVRVSGQLDTYNLNGLIQDYKLVSLYQVKDGVKEEYEQQLNCYAALLRGNGLEVNALELVCILRDWSKGKAKSDYTLPQQQIIKLQVPLWSQEKALAFLTDRVKIHKAANKKLTLCTPEERWADPDKWAVMPKKNAARSLKNHLIEEEAKEHSASVKGSFVEFRPGVNKRCDAYCSVAPFCTQYKQIKGDK